jgi:CubicO group peptidase (beta-lactamase class C family)
MRTGTLEEVTPEAVGFSSARLRRIDEAMERLVDQGTVAGAVTLVARHGKVAHFAATGRMDVEAGAPMRRDAIFRLASMTKPITAVAVLLLYEEGRFLLDDPIREFLPEFAQTKVFVREAPNGANGVGGLEVADLERELTIRQLLTHTSGVASGVAAETPVGRRYAEAQLGRLDEPPDRQVRRLAQLPLAHQPGIAWTYGLSYDVLARLVEVVSGQAFDVFLRERLFAPLGMVDTGYDVPAHGRGRLTAVYTPGEHGGLQRATYPGVDRTEPRVYCSGGSELVSTAADYARFCQLLLNRGTLGDTRLLGRKTVELMTADQMPGQPSPFPPSMMPGAAGLRMALGVGTLVDVAAAGLPGSVGSYTWGGAACTYFWVDPMEDLLGLFLVQRLPPSVRLVAPFPVLTYQALVD